MTKEKTKVKKGFTIIEVVLVLAIAGLIFLMVFVALPALQRSQRDTQRRDDMARLATAITQFQTNNNNKVPMAMGNNKPSSADFISKYLGGADSFKDPDGEPYTISFNTGTSISVPASVNHTIYVNNKARCNGESVQGSGNTNDYVIVYKLEGSGTFCQDNQ